MMMMMMIRKRERPAGQQRLTRGINAAECERVRPEYNLLAPLRCDPKSIEFYPHFPNSSQIQINKNRLLIIDFH
jgi:hypothetical protein